VNITAQKKIIEIRKLFDIWKDLDEKSTLTSLDAFLVIAVSGSISNTELIKRSGCTKSHVSLITSVLAIYGRGNKPGLGLIASTEDSMDRRYKMLTLTRKGEELAERINKLLSDGVNDESI
jgi:DNA-binding MarR family transcriptional regulator